MLFWKTFALIGTYLALQPIRFTRTPCHHGVPWALTPRFHPFLARGGWFFSVALAVRSLLSQGRAFPLGSMAPCAVPTFLPRLSTGAAERAADRCKGTIKRGEREYPWPTMFIAPTSKDVGSIFMTAFIAPTSKDVGSISCKEILILPAVNKQSVLIVCLVYS